MWADVQKKKKVAQLLGWADLETPGRCLPPEACWKSRHPAAESWKSHLCCRSELKRSRLHHHHVRLQLVVCAVKHLHVTFSQPGPTAAIQELPHQQQEKSDRKQSVDRPSVSSLTSPCSFRKQPARQPKKLLSQCLRSLLIHSKERWTSMVLGFPSIIRLWDEHSELHCVLTVLVAGKAAPVAVPAHPRRAALPFQALLQH